jgi:hypothetical protein
LDQALITNNRIVTLPDNADDIALKPGYHTIYNAVVQPHRVFTVTQYFLRFWLPLLKPSPAWLIITLQQRCYWNGTRDWCEVSQERLGRDIGLTDRGVRKLLKRCPYASWFIMKAQQQYCYDRSLGRQIRDRKKYTIYQSDPLTPQHQAGLAAILSQTDVANLEKTLHALAKVPQEELIAQLEAAASGNQSPNLAEGTVRAVVEYVLGARIDDEAPLRQDCDNLHDHITILGQPFLGTHYFRLKWVPILGTTLAWLVVILRNSCYHNPKTGQHRHTCTWEKEEIARALGQTPRNFLNLIKHQFAGVFFEEIKRESGQITFQVSMWQDREPIIPDDLEILARHNYNLDLERFDFWQDLIEDQEKSSGSGKKVPQDGRGKNFARRKKVPVEGQEKSSGSGKKVPQGGQEKSSVRRKDIPVTSQEKSSGREKSSAHVEDQNGKKFLTHKDSIRPSDSEKRQEQQTQSAAVPSLQTTLDNLSIQEPTRSRLLADPNLTAIKVNAWFLYAETQKGLKDPRGYAIRRLLENDPPPEEFLAFARLDERTWALFEETAYRLRTGLPLAVERIPELVDTFVSWARVYGNLDPAETQYLLAQQRELPGPEYQPVELPGNETARNLWQTTLGQLQTQMTRQTFDTWVKPTQALEYDGETVVVGTKSAFAKDWLENRLAKTIERTLSNIAGRPTQVRFVLSD